MIDVLFWFMGISWAVLMFLFTADKFSDSTWFCEKLGWHRAPTNVGFDGCSRTGTCPRCGKSVLQDSQGNWF
jgi:hypothetical protein